MIKRDLIAFLVLGILIASFSSFINVQGGADDPAVRKFISAKCDEACATSCDGYCASKALMEESKICEERGQASFGGCGEFERLWQECMAECTSGYAARQAKEAVLVRVISRTGCAQDAAASRSFVRCVAPRRK